MNTVKVYAFIRSNFTNDLINYFKIENSLIIEDIKSLQRLKSKYNITNLFYTDFKNKIKNYSFKDIKIMNYNPRNRYNSYYYNNSYINFLFLKKYIISNNESNLAISAMDYNFPLYIKHKNIIFSVVKNVSELIDQFRFIKDFSKKYYNNSSFYLQRALKKCNKICIDFYYNEKLYILNSYDIIIQYLNKNIFMKTPSTFFLSNKEFLYNKLDKYLKTIKYKFFGRIEILYDRNKFYLYTIKKTKPYLIKYYKIFDSTEQLFNIFYGKLKNIEVFHPFFKTKYICVQYDYDEKKKYYFNNSHSEPFLTNKKTQIINSKDELIGNGFFINLIKKHFNNKYLNIINLFDNNKYCIIQSNNDHNIRKEGLNDPLDNYNYSIGHSILKQNNNYSIEVNNSEISIIFYYETKICITGYTNICQLNNININKYTIISIKYRDKLFINNENNKDGNICYISLLENIIINSFVIQNNNKIICLDSENLFNNLLNDKIYNVIPLKNNNIKFLLGPHNFFYKKDILNVFQNKWYVENITHNKIILTRNRKLSRERKGSFNKIFEKKFNLFYPKGTIYYDNYKINIIYNNDFIKLKSYCIGHVIISHIWKLCQLKIDEEITFISVSKNYSKKYSNMIHNILINIKNDNNIIIPKIKDNTIDSTNIIEFNNNNFVINITELYDNYIYVLYFKITNLFNSLSRIRFNIQQLRREYKDIYIINGNFSYIIKVRNKKLKNKIINSVINLENNFILKEKVLTNCFKVPIIYYQKDKSFIKEYIEYLSFYVRGIENNIIKFFSFKNNKMELLYESNRCYFIINGQKKFYTLPIKNIELLDEIQFYLVNNTNFQSIYKNYLNNNYKVIYSECEINDKINNYYLCTNVSIEKKSFYGEIVKKYIKKGNNVEKGDNLFLVRNNYSEYNIQSNKDGFILYFEIKKEYVVFYVLY